MKIIKTSQAMPETGEYVLAWLENTTTPMRAMWVAQFTLPVGDDADPEWGEYSEEKDDYFCPAGWYEMNRHEEQHWSVDGNVVAWCELPRLDAGAAPAAVSQRGEYPQLPEGVMFIEQVGGDVIGRPTDYGFKHGRGIVHGAELFTSEQLRAYFDLGRQPSTAAPALEAPPAVAPQGEYPHEQMDAMALARYKVVPSHASMLWSHAVVAGDGAQQLYVGREVECQNMARKFAGAFLDGAFAFHSMAAAPTAQAAPALEAPAAVDGDQLDSLARKKLGALLNAFGEAQWQAGRGVPCPSIEDAFEAVISAAVALLAAAPQAPAQEAPAAPAPAVPDGWRLVPANPTDAMLGAAQKAWLADPLRRSSTVYAAALAAAPQAPAAPSEGLEALLNEALAEVKRIVDAEQVSLAPTYHNEVRRPNDKRKFHMGDARRAARNAAAALEKAFDVVIVGAVAAPAAPSGRYKLADDGAHQYLDGIEARYSIEREDGTTVAWVLGNEADAKELMAAIGAAPAAPAVDAQAHAETLKKAARYDFLRGSNVANGTVLAEHFGGSRMQDFDAVIDAKIAARAAQAKEGGAPVADAAPLDVCTDPYNCARCKTHPAHRGDMHHAGISRIGGSA